MFKDMRQTGVIRRRGGEGDGKAVFRVVRVQMQEARAGLDVLETAGDSPQVRQFRNLVVFMCMLAFSRRFPVKIHVFAYIFW